MVTQNSVKNYCARQDPFHGRDTLIDRMAAVMDKWKFSHAGSREITWLSRAYAIREIGYQLIRPGDGLIPEDLVICVFPRIWKSLVL